MKTILAMIRIDRMNETKRALSDAGLPSFFATGKVFGRGKGLWDAKVLEGVKQDKPEAIAQLGPQPRLRPQRLLTIVVKSEKVKLAVKTIMEANCTEKPGDGKIFVLPATDAVSIRSGIYGDSVLDQ